MNSWHPRFVYYRVGVHPHNVHWFVYTLPCNCTLHSLQLTLDRLSVQCTLCSVHCTVLCVLCTVTVTVHCTVYS